MWTLAAIAQRNQNRTDVPREERKWYGQAQTPFDPYRVAECKMQRYWCERPGRLES